jgi:hypothetical protein
MGRHAFHDELAHHLHECGMRADRCGAHHVKTELARPGGGLLIEVQHHLQVIADEADRHDHDILDLLCGQRGQRL